MYREMEMRFWLEQAQSALLGGRRTDGMTVFRWSEAGRSWRPVEGEPPEGLGGAQVGLYETLMTSASAYALALHADRIARSWERLTGRPFSAEPVPPLLDGRAEAIRQQWPALRFEVRRFADARHRRADPAAGQAVGEAAAAAAAGGVRRVGRRVPAQERRDGNI